MDSCGGAADRSAMLGQVSHTGTGGDFPQHQGQKAHHAGAVTVVADGHLGARLAAASMTSQAGVLDVHTQVFICTHHCL